jgi:hypothetical protein
MELLIDHKPKGREKDLTLIKYLYITTESENASKMENISNGLESGRIPPTLRRRVNSMQMKSIVTNVMKIHTDQMTTFFIPITPRIWFVKKMFFYQKTNSDSSLGMN